MKKDHNQDINHFLKIQNLLEKKKEIIKNDMDIHLIQIDKFYIKLLKLNASKLNFHIIYRNIPIDILESMDDSGRYLLDPLCYERLDKHRSEYGA